MRAGLSKDLQINGENYFAVGSFNLHAFANMACTVINTTLGKNYGVELAEETIAKGLWTYDLLYSLANGISTDVNGDGMMNRKDIYGVGCSDERSAAAMAWISAGFRTLKPDDNSTELSVNVYGNERFVDILTKVQNILVYGSACYQDDGKDYTWGTVDIFTAGREWAMITLFGEITAFRDMEDDFTVVPVPKYEENTAEYSSRTFDSYFTLVPQTAVNTDMIGAVLDVMSYYAYCEVIPAYIETTLKGKVARDEMSTKYIQLAFDTRHIDLGEALIFDVFGDGYMFEHLQKNPLQITSYFESKQHAIDDAFTKIVALADIDAK